MQPTLCTRCKKRVAVVFISKIEKGETVNEGLCLKCAKDLGLPQVNEMMRRMGITDDDLDTISEEMMQAFGGAESMEGLIPQGEDAEGDEDGKTATFPFQPPLRRRRRPQRPLRRERPQPRAQRAQDRQDPQAEVSGQLLHQPHRAGPLREAFLRKPLENRFTISRLPARSASGLSYHVLLVY